MKDNAMQIDIAYMEEIRTEIERTESVIPYLKEHIRESAAWILQAADDERRRELCRQFYWEWPEVSTGIICDALNCRRHDSLFDDVVGTYTFIRECCLCHQERPVTVKSRSELQQSRRSVVCDSCRAERHAQNSQAREVYKQQEAQRQVILDELRSMPYSEYLQTEHWQTVRKQALKRARYRCQMCGSNGTLHVHHNNYENRGRELAADVIVLCSDCHEQFHFGTVDEQV